MKYAFKTLVIIFCIFLLNLQTIALATTKSPTKINGIYGLDNNLIETDSLDKIIDQSSKLLSYIDNADDKEITNSEESVDTNANDTSENTKDEPSGGTTEQDEQTTNPEEPVDVNNDNGSENTEDESSGVTTEQDEQTTDPEEPVDINNDNNGTQETISDPTKPPQGQQENTNEAEQNQPQEPPPVNQPAGILNENEFVRATRTLKNGIEKNINQFFELIADNLVSGITKYDVSNRKVTKNYYFYVYTPGVDDLVSLTQEVIQHITQNQITPFLSSEEVFYTAKLKDINITQDNVDNLLPVNYSLIFQKQDKYYLEDGNELTLESDTESNGIFKLNNQLHSLIWDDDVGGQINERIKKADSIFQAVQGKVGTWHDLFKAKKLIATDKGTLDIVGSENLGSPSQYVFYYPDETTIARPIEVITTYRPSFLSLPKIIYYPKIEDGIIERTNGETLIYVFEEIVNNPEYKEGESNTNVPKKITFERYFIGDGTELILRDGSLWINEEATYVEPDIGTNISITESIASLRKGLVSPADANVDANTKRTKYELSVKLLIELRNKYHTLATRYYQLIGERKKKEKELKDRPTDIDVANKIIEYDNRIYLLKAKLSSLNESFTTTFKKLLEDLKNEDEKENISFVKNLIQKTYPQETEETRPILNGQHYDIVGILKIIDKAFDFSTIDVTNLPAGEEKHSIVNGKLLEQSKNQQEKFDEDLKNLNSAASEKFKRISDLYEKTKKSFNNLLSDYKKEDGSLYKQIETLKSETSQLIQQITIELLNYKQQTNNNLYLWWYVTYIVGDKTKELEEVKKLADLRTQLIQLKLDIENLHIKPEEKIEDTIKQYGITDESIIKNIISNTNSAKLSLPVLLNRLKLLKKIDSEILSKLNLPSVNELTENGLLMELSKPDVFTIENVKASLKSNKLSNPYFILARPVETIISKYKNLLTKKTEQTQQSLNDYLKLELQQVTAITKEITTSSPDLWEKFCVWATGYSKSATDQFDEYTEKRIEIINNRNLKVTSLYNELKNTTNEITTLQVHLSRFNSALFKSKGFDLVSDLILFRAWKVIGYKKIKKIDPEFNQVLKDDSWSRLEVFGELQKIDKLLMNSQGYTDKALEELIQEVNSNPIEEGKSNPVPSKAQIEDYQRILAQDGSINRLKDIASELQVIIEKLKILSSVVDTGRRTENFVSFAHKNAEKLNHIIYEAGTTNEISRAQALLFNNFTNKQILPGIPELQEFVRILVPNSYTGKQIEILRNKILAMNDSTVRTWFKEELPKLLLGLVIAVGAVLTCPTSWTGVGGMACAAILGTLGYLIGSEVAAEGLYKFFDIGEGSLYGQWDRGNYVLDQNGRFVKMDFLEHVVDGYLQQWFMGTVTTFATMGLGTTFCKAISKTLNIGSASNVKDKFLKEENKALLKSIQDNLAKQYKTPLEKSIIKQTLRKWVHEFNEEFREEIFYEPAAEALVKGLLNLDSLLNKTIGNGNSILGSALVMSRKGFHFRVSYKGKGDLNLRYNQSETSSSNLVKDLINAGLTGVSLNADGNITVKSGKETFSIQPEPVDLGDITNDRAYQYLLEITEGNLEINSSIYLLQPGVSAETIVEWTPEGTSVTILLSPEVVANLKSNDPNLVNDAKTKVLEEINHGMQEIVDPSCLSDDAYIAQRYFGEILAESVSLGKTGQTEAKRLLAEVLSEMYSLISEGYYAEAMKIAEPFITDQDKEIIKEDLEENRSKDNIDEDGNIKRIVQSNYNAKNRETKFNDSLSQGEKLNIGIGDTTIIVESLGNGEFKLNIGGTEHILISGNLLIVGREVFNDIQIINDPKVSASHLTLQSEGGKLKITDLGSTNGTKVNKVINQQQEVRNEFQKTILANVIQLAQKLGITSSTEIETILKIFELEYGAIRFPSEPYTKNYNARELHTYSTRTDVVPYQASGWLYHASTNINHDGRPPQLDRYSLNVNLNKELIKELDAFIAEHGGRYKFSDDSNTRYDSITYYPSESLSLEAEMKLAKIANTYIRGDGKGLTGESIKDSLGKEVLGIKKEFDLSEGEVIALIDLCNHLDPVLGRAIDRWTAYTPSSGRQLSTGQVIALKNTLNKLGIKTLSEITPAIGKLKIGELANIGREGDITANDMPLSVSRKHVRIERLLDGSYEIINISSGNTVKVIDTDGNITQLTTDRRIKIKPGDIIILGGEYSILIPFNSQNFTSYLIESRLILCSENQIKLELRMVA